MAIVSFTGSRHGMSERQEESVRRFLLEHSFDEGAHGDCVGADAQFHAICVELGMKTRAYPGYSVQNPTDFSYRAFCEAGFIAEPQSHFARNRTLANLGEQLIACPYDESGKGGTWYTINYYTTVLKKTPIIFYR